MIIFIYHLIGINRFHQSELRLLLLPIIKMQGDIYLVIGGLGHLRMLLLLVKAEIYIIMELGFQIQR